MSETNQHYDLIEKYQRNRRWFVETGTALGDTAAWVADRGWFDKVITIEFMDNYYANAAIRFLDYKNVYPIHADSAVMLGTLIYNWGRGTPDTVFWLDAHYTHGSEDIIAPSGETPIIQELKHVFYGNSDHVVLIDDARLFGNNPAYPTLGEVSDIATASGYRTEIFGDIIVVDRGTNDC